MEKKLQRKTVEIKQVRIPLRKLLHGFEIREAAENLKNFRLKLLEEELMLGAKLTIKMEPHSDAILVARRPETDKEYTDRLEKARLAAEAKIERERIRKIQAEERAKRAEEMKKQNVAKTISEMVKSNQMTLEELTELLKVVDKT